MQILEVAQEADLAATGLGETCGVEPFRFLYVVPGVLFAVPVHHRGEKAAVLVAEGGEPVAGVEDVRRVCVTFGDRSQ